MDLEDELDAAVALGDAEDEIKRLRAALVHIIECGDAAKVGSDVGDDSPWYAIGRMRQTARIALGIPGSAQSADETATPHPRDREGATDK